MSNQVVRVRKVQLIPLADSKEKFSEIYGEMHRISNLGWIAANKVVNGQYYLNCLFWKIKEEKPDATSKEIDSIIKEIIGTSQQNYSYRALKEVEIPSVFKSAISNKVGKFFQSDKQDVNKGKKSVRNYKQGMPVPFIQGKIFELDGEYVLQITKGLRFILAFGRDKGSVKPIVNRIISGEYKYCDSEYYFKDKKLMLNLCYMQPVDTHVALNENKYVGVDLGMSIPAVCALSDSPARRYVGNGKAIISKRMQIKSAIHNLQKNLKHTTGGKGRKNKLQALERFKEKERHFIDNVMHEISKEIVDFALINKAGNIVLEDLKGLRNINKFLARNFGYYNLRQKITYKAEGYGIKVHALNPAYTSQTCACCGNREKKQRIKRDTFKCNNASCHEFGIEVHADYNAAKNIARLPLVSLVNG